MSTDSAPPLETPPASNLTANVTITAIESAVAYSSLYGMALFCIYLGSFASLWFVRKETKELGKKLENSITWKEAKWFPVTASAVLFTLYVFFKYGDEMPTLAEKGIDLLGKVLPKLAARLSALLPSSSSSAGTGKAAESAPPAPVVVGGSGPNGTCATWDCVPRLNKETVMTALMVLLCFEGCVALSQLIKPVVSRVLRLLPLKESSDFKRNPTHVLRFFKREEEKKEKDEKKEEKGSDEKETVVADSEREADIDSFHLEFDVHDLVSLLCCLPIMAAHLKYRHWTTNNILGISFSLYGIGQLHLSNFKAGVLLLSGLFIYDIFWVFATDVMTTVAMGIKAPILLMFPQDLIANGLIHGKKFAMLGLGDIVIPGIFLALLLRFDNENGGGGEGRRPSRFYFHATMAAYAVGLMTTIGVMHLFKAAQPALLYLVPACLGCPLLLASIRGESKLLLEFSEDHLVKKDKEEEAAKKKDE